MSTDLRQTSGWSTTLLFTLPGIATRNLLNKLEKTWLSKATAQARWVFLDPALNI